MVKIEKNISLKKYNTYGVGGNADYFILAKEKEDLVYAFNFAKERGIPYIILGGGSNVLISDEGFRGLVIVNRASGIERVGNKIKALSGTPLSRVVNFTTKNELAGTEFLSGIPGTFGGAILGNAGAWGKSISDIVDSVEFLDSDGIRNMNRDELGFGYRDSKLKKMDGIILSATLVLKNDSSESISRNIDDILKKRKGLQHPRGKTCGSYFKNIETKNLDKETLEKLREWVIGEKIAAARFIDEAGCRGMRVGDAEVSDVHTNFIVNVGNATASDIVKLAGRIQKKVYDKFRVELEPEVRYL